MGGLDKALLTLGPRAMVDAVLSRMRPQCASIAISANGDARRFADRCPVIADAPGPRLGPLAGVLAGLDAVAAAAGPPWLLTMPVDTPFIPHDLARRLSDVAESSGRPIARVTYDGREHPLVALWRVDLREPLRAALHGRGIRRVRSFQAEAGVADLPWPAQATDPFVNINTPETLAAARARVAGEASTGPEG